MAIGTIDCTVHKSLCDQHKVRGYPTLKFSLDGELYDYPGGRTEKDFLDFATKLQQPVVASVTTVTQAKQIAAQAEEGVAFLAYHPAAVTGSDVDAKLQSTALLQVLAQVARKMRAVATFALLDTSAAQDDEAAAALASELSDGPFVCRLEANVQPRCITDEKIGMESLLQWIEAQNLATVSHLGAHNFHKVGRSGKPVVIAVVAEENTEELETAKRSLAQYATAGKYKEKYNYGWFDGNVWKRFLAQFDVVPADMPQVIVLNVPMKQYWQNESYKLNVDDFLEDVQNGKVELKSAGKPGMEGFLGTAYQLFKMYRPWSVIAAVLVFAAFVVLIVSCVTPGKDFRPPYPREEMPGSGNTKVEKVKTGDTAAASKNGEPKKDK
jgi:protein disulfide-isomerase A1